MHTRRQNQPESLPRSRNCYLTCAGSLLLAMLAGCASPGPPLPPSLNLPEIATGVTATRTGNQVALHWTTPGRTTDRLAIRGTITAVLCRREVQPIAVQALRAEGPLRNGNSNCTAVARVEVSPGESNATDTLPQGLKSGMPHLLAYRVALLNASGQSAGVSAPVFVATGPSPAPVQTFRARSEKAGVVLEWLPEAADAADTVEITRTVMPSNPAQVLPHSGAAGLESAPGEARFSVAPDVGGSIDRTAVFGNVYSYSAKRVRTVRLGGEAVQISSTTASPVTVAVRDVFPPERPSGLVAVPGLRGTGAKALSSIDLSWDANLEPRLAGYRVYRRDSGQGSAWRLLTQELVRTPAYSDVSVEAGRPYTYRVTAVSDNGVESLPSPEASETAPSPW